MRATGAIGRARWIARASAEYYKQLVPNAEVTLPGSTCATCTPQNLSPANTWTPQNLALLVERLGGAIVATHSQSGIMGHHMVRILKERGQLDLVKGLITIEGGCSLPNSGLTAADFDAIPYLALKGDYTATSAQCQETVDAINKRRAEKQGTARAEYMKLDEMGMLGVTHMMMLDSNSNRDRRHHDRLGGQERPANGRAGPFGPAGQGASERTRPTIPALRVARRRSAFRNRLTADRQSSLNRTTRADDALLRVVFDRLVFGALAAEALQDREVPLVTFVRQHLISGR